MSKTPSASVPEIYQFGPTKDHPNYPGVFGWGFDTHGYRIVVYGPPEADHPVVREAIEKLHIHKPRRGDNEDEELPAGFRLKTRRHSNRHKADVDVCRRRGEHGPAHIHVFDIQSGRETRFELILHYQRGEHKVRPLHLSKKRGDCLTPNQEAAVTPILENSTEVFTQLWQELYQDSKLSGYVTRKALQELPGGKKVKVEEVEEILDSEDWVVTRDQRGNLARIPPKNMVERVERHEPHHPARH